MTEVWDKILAGACLPHCQTARDREARLRCDAMRLGLVQKNEVSREFVRQKNSGSLARAKSLACKEVKAFCAMFPAKVDEYEEPAASEALSGLISEVSFRPPSVSPGCLEPHT